MIRDHLPQSFGPEIGAPRARVEDDRLLAGRGRFVDDRSPRDCLHLVFVRSPVARGRLLRLELQGARDIPGVISIITAAELPPIGPLPVNQGMLTAAVPRRALLARDQVRYVGEPLAAVVAVSPQVARDAADRIHCEIDPQAPASDEAFTHSWRFGSPASAFASAHAVVKARLDQPLVAPVPMEPRVMLAEWHGATSTMTIWASSQSPHRLRSNLASLLRLDIESIHAVAADVGGAFGGKASIYPEEVVTAWAAMQLKRSVKWTATRSEDMLSASYGRGAVLGGELAVDREGRLLGMRANVKFPLGAWLPYSALVPAWNASRIVPGPYAVPNVEVTAQGVLTDTAPVGIYRGAGRPEAAILMERLLDEAAAATGIDPAELRRRNLLQPDLFPYRTPSGETLDSGDYPALLGACLESARYAELRAERQSRQARGELFGLGLAFYVEPCGRGDESARVTLERDGSVTVASGTNPQGQGHETSLAQIAADALAVPFDRIRIVQGDTRLAPPGVGALASRSTAIGGSAVLEAARQAAARALQGEPLPIEASVAYKAPGEAWSAGCCLAAVAVDAETGELRIERFVWSDDAGRVINPLLVEGQLVGGFAQGLGQVLMEALVHDQDGQLLTGTLMDYALPRASDMPGISLAKLQTASPANALGAKGVGESGPIGTPAAILNAALDALSVRGIREVKLPLTSHNLWRAIQGKENQA